MAACLSLAALSTVEAIEDKCSACDIVAGHLWSRLAGEKSKEVLDLRNRLDSEGVRQGRKIPYMESEQRLTELLDGLCETLPEAHPSKEGGWQVKTNGGSGAQDPAFLQQKKRELGNFCAGLLDSHEDSVSQLVQKKWPIKESFQQAVGSLMGCSSARRPAHDEL